MTAKTWIAAALLASTAWACTGRDRARPVEVAAERGPLVLRWEAVAELRPVRTEVVRSPMGGKVAVLALAPIGTGVDAGAVVAELDASALRTRRAELGAELAAARRQVAEAETALALHDAATAATLARLEGELRSARFDLDTFHGRAVSLDEAAAERDANPWARAVDDARQALEAARDGADDARARLAAAREGARAVHGLVAAEVARVDAEIAAAVVPAPCAGVVTEVPGAPALHVGALVRQRQPLRAVVDAASMTADLRVPASCGVVEVGAAVDVRVAASPDRVFRGRVESCATPAGAEPGAAQPDAAAMLEVEISVDALGAALAPGMAASISGTAAPIAGAVHVPAAAVDDLPGGPVVYRWTPAGTEAVPVTIGRSDADRVEILAGLDAGARIVADARLGRDRRPGARD